MSWVNAQHARKKWAALSPYLSGTTRRLLSGDPRLLLYTAPPRRPTVGAPCLNISQALQNSLHKVRHEVGRNPLLMDAPVSVMTHGRSPIQPWAFRMLSLLSNSEPNVRGRSRATGGP